jgi:hypothetical protein
MIHDLAHAIIYKYVPLPCPARHGDVRPRDVSTRLLGGWAVGPAGMRELAWLAWVATVATGSR